MIRITSLIVALIAAFALTAFSQRTLKEAHDSLPSVDSEALYLPNERAVEVISFGYKKVFANYLWFRTINYFGKHYASDQNYRWLYHMCDLVSTLDPQSKHVYDFCSTMLSWEVNAPLEAIKILDKGVSANPKYWKFHYLRGFTWLYFLNDKARAYDDFIAASKLPDVHPMVVTIAAKTMAAQDDPEDGIEFLRSVLRTTNDEFARGVLVARLKELSYERDLRLFEKALEQYRSAQQTSPKKIEELAPFLEQAVSLSDPFGGSYTLDSSGEKITSTSNHKRLGKNK